MFNVRYQCLFVELFFLIHTSVYFYKTDLRISCFLLPTVSKINRNGAPESLENSTDALYCFRNFECLTEPIATD